MRIIAGIRKGQKLSTLPGQNTRPTADYVREAIFSMIFDCEDMRVLDLFSGSGVMGFEALSRGAESLEIVESVDKAVKVVLKNIGALRFENEIIVHHKKADTFIKTTLNKYDLIFVDPPYNKGFVNTTLEAIYQYELLDEDGTIVVEHSDQEKIRDDFQPFIEKQKKYGNTLVTMFNSPHQNETVGIEDDNASDI
ncbi:MAG: 16S rRNA (guanine(966)-N(2))-methyltransferase RsmD [Candidatus Cloacimonadia bacterium]|jgi:16S rRNA (guanine966-N2)-methyltransferase